MMSTPQGIVGAQFNHHKLGLVLGQQGGQAGATTGCGGFAADAGVDHVHWGFLRRCLASGLAPPNSRRAMPYSAERLSPATSTTSGRWGTSVGKRHRRKTGGKQPAQSRDSHCACFTGIGWMSVTPVWPFRV